MVKNSVQLITYPDSLGGNLKTLNSVLEKHFSGLFTGGVHILPPFPSSGDRGFAPLTYFEIEPAFGTWEDIKRIGEKHAVLLDLMVNHISARSTFFQDFLQNGFDSSYADLFLTIEKLWPDSEPVQADIDKIFLRRAKPYSEFTIAKTGARQKVWTTFGKTDPSEQIDLDIKSPLAIDLITKIMTNFQKNNVKIVRLDAVGYVIKKLGTSCFFLEPEIYQFMNWISQLGDSMQIELLPEIHAENKIQSKLAENGFWIYDFILPYTILETLISKSANNLKQYLLTRSNHQFTMLDCHDGVPIKPDMDGMYLGTNARKVVEHCRAHGANFSLIVNDAHKDADGFDVHQIRGTYYSILGCNDSAYLIARAIQFFAPGIPQVYYVGLLAGKNDLEAVANTGEGREINRHNYSVEEIDQQMNTDVVKRLIELIKFRNSNPAFNGTFTVEDSDANILMLSWKQEENVARLIIDLENLTGEILYTQSEENKVQRIAL
jgi:sucrose phosphorylase